VSKKEDIKKKKKIEALKQRREEAMKEAGARAARTMGKATAEKDAFQENQVGERYKDVNPIISNGAFGITTPKKADDNLTQAELNRKMKRKQNKLP